MSKTPDEAIADYVEDLSDVISTVIQASGFLIVVPFLALTILASSVLRWQLLVISVPMVVSTVFFATTMALMVDVRYKSNYFKGTMAMGTYLKISKQEDLDRVDGFLGKGTIGNIRKQVEAFDPSKWDFPSGTWAIKLFTYGVVMLVVTLFVVVLALA